MAGEAQLFGTAAAAIGIALRERHHKKQFEDFQQNELSVFQGNIQASVEAISKEEDPDMMAQHFLGFKQAQMDFLTSAAKYSDNPLIANTAMSIFQANQGLMGEFLQAEEVFEGRTPEAKEQKARMAKAGVEQAEAGVETEKQRPKLLAAQTEKEKAQAEYYRRATPEGAVKPRQMFTGPAGTPPSEWMKYIYRPEMSEEIDREKQSVRYELAQQMLLQRRGQDKPGEIGISSKWGDDPKNDLQAISLELSEEEVRREVERRIIIREHGPMGLLAFGERYLPPQEVEAQQKTLQGSVPDRRIAEQLLGADGLKAMEELKSGATLNMGTITKGLPDVVTQLPSGPLQSGFTTIASYGGNRPDNNELFKDYDEVVRWLRSYGEEKIRTRIGNNVEDKQLDKATRVTRNKARKLLAAMITKYAPQVAAAIGVELPGAQRGSILGNSFFGRTTIGRGIKGAETALGDVMKVLRGQTEGIVEPEEIE